MERGDLVLVRGFVLGVRDGIATVAFGEGGQQVQVPADALEVRAGPVSRLDALAYEVALRGRYAGMLAVPPDMRAANGS